jgi:hypothetical protein
VEHPGRTTGESAAEPATSSDDSPGADAEARPDVAGGASGDVPAADAPPAAPPPPPLDPEAELAAANACIERLGGPSESSSSEPRPGVEAWSRASRAIVVSRESPGADRLLFGDGPVRLAVDRAAILRARDERNADSLSRHGREPMPDEESVFQRLREAPPGDARLETIAAELLQHPGGALIQIEDTAAGEVEAGRFVLVNAEGAVVGGTVVREEHGSQSGGRSGAGGRAFYAPDCTRVLDVLDWIS